jgi:hypothetical protein
MNAPPPFCIFVDGIRHASDSSHVYDANGEYPGLTVTMSFNTLICHATGAYIDQSFMHWLVTR